MQRGSGNFRGGRGRGRGGAFGNVRGGRGGGRGGMQRVETANGIPAPPATPFDDPFILPFPRLLPKNATGSMTLDEDLLRAIIGQFTVIGTSCLDFNELFMKLKAQRPELIEAIYNSPPHLWSYIRCYPEQFGVDQDPRFPWSIYYLSKCKIVAKADRNRYHREFADGNIRPVPDIEKAMNAVPYNVEMEKRAVTHFYAIFEQYARMTNATAYHLEMQKIATVFRPHAGVPKEVCAYVGEVDAFLLKRLYFFNSFGGQVGVCPPGYATTVRKLTLFLKEHGQGGYFELKKFYEAFRDSGIFTDDDFRAINLGAMFTYDDFVLFLNQHRLIFHLFTRDNRIKLRHDVVPEISREDVAAVPTYTTLNDVFLQDTQPAAAVEREVAVQSQAAVAHDQRAGSTDGEFEEDDGFYNDSFDGLPPQVPQVPTSRQRLTNNVQHGGSLTLATARSNNDVLAALTLVATDRTANRNTIATNPVVEQDDMEGLPVFQNPEPPVQTRFVLRGGARPPRASVRCRPPAPGRHSQTPMSSGPTGVTPTSGSQGGASMYQHLEEELDSEE